jgi:GntR family transcriptional regulator / MocR family aminotransferase
MGYIVASEDTVQAVARQILLLDRQGDQVTECAVASFIEADELMRHARRALGLYRQRRDAFDAALRSTIGDRARFSKPMGGLAFWLEFEDESKLDRIEQNARLGGLRLLRSEQFRLSSRARRGLRLGFASKTEREAIDSLAILFGNPAPSVERFNDPSRPAQVSSRT